MERRTWSLTTPIFLSHTGFSFQESPILHDLDQLEDFPTDRVLSMDEIKKHEEKISSLLEVASTTGKAAESTFSPAYSRSF